MSAMVITLLWIDNCGLDVTVARNARTSPGGPVVKTPHFPCKGHGSIPGWGTNILHALWPKRKKENFFNRIQMEIQHEDLTFF